MNKKVKFNGKKNKKIVVVNRGKDLRNLKKEYSCCQKTQRMIYQQY
ncbi:hypothetical protein [Anaerococcus sp. AGMB09787]|nr:hypothetical protein [Anaerococcus sp. AGMB09787]